MVHLMDLTETSPDVMYTHDNIVLTMNDQYVGLGKLYLSEHAFAWQAPGEPCGFYINWNRIAILERNFQHPFDQRKGLRFMVKFTNLDLDDKEFDSDFDDDETDEEFMDSDDDEGIFYDPYKYAPIYGRCGFTFCWVVPLDDSINMEMVAEIQECHGLNSDSMMGDDFVQDLYGLRTHIRFNNDSNFDSEADGIPAIDSDAEVVVNSDAESERLPEILERIGEIALGFSAGIDIDEDMFYFLEGNTDTESENDYDNLEYFADFEDDNKNEQDYDADNEDDYEAGQCEQQLEYKEKSGDQPVNRTNFVCKTECESTDKNEIPETLKNELVDMTELETSSNADFITEAAYETKTCDLNETDTGLDDKAQSDTELESELEDIFNDYISRLADKVQMNVTVNHSFTEECETVAESMTLSETSNITIDESIPDLELKPDENVTSLKDETECNFVPNTEAGPKTSIEATDTDEANHDNEEDTEINYNYKPNTEEELEDELEFSEHIKHVEEILSMLP